MPRHLVGIFSARREISRGRHPGSSDTRDPLPLLLPLLPLSPPSHEQSGSRTKRGEEKSLQKFLFSTGNTNGASLPSTLRLFVEGRGPAIHAVSRRTPFLSLLLSAAAVPCSRDNDIAGRERNASARFTTPAGAAFTGAKLIS